MNGFLFADQAARSMQSSGSISDVAGGDDATHHVSLRDGAQARRPKKAVFLDKDGTLIADVPYNVDPGLMGLNEGAGAALRLLRDRGFALYVISNQSGVAHGRFEESALHAVWHRLQELLAVHAVTLDGFYYCPHHPDGCVGQFAKPCDCRKPLPGMLWRAAHEHNIDLGASWMVGDILHDIEAGRRAGCRTMLIENGNETEWELSPLRVPHRRAPDLYLAARMIVQDHQTRPQQQVHHKSLTQQQVQPQGQPQGQPRAQTQNNAQSGEPSAVSGFNAATVIPTR